VKVWRRAVIALNVHSIARLRRNGTNHDDMFAMVARALLHIANGIMDSSEALGCGGR
jgi:hypothetical protein